MVIFKQKQPDASALLFAFLAGLAGEGEAHNCDECANYSDCILPFKKERKDGASQQHARPN